MIYDLIVIGGGPAGYYAAEQAGHEGLNTLLIEKRFIGGVCLNEGCVPSKTLLYSAKIYDSIKHGEAYGITFADLKMNHSAIIERKNKIVKTLVMGVNAKLRKSNVTVISGLAKIIGRALEGFSVTANDIEYTAKRLMIATGSMPIVPSIPGIKDGIEKGFVLTNREMLDIQQIPKSLVVIGGGVIGLEMASYFNSAGSKVTIIEMLDHIAGSIDLEISGILMKSYQEKGIKFELESKVIEITDNKVIFEARGKKHEAQADKILLSVGRKPVIEGLGIESIGVEIDRGRIKVDEHGKTNIPEVYAAGDVNGLSMLAHTAYREANVCVNTMLGKRDTMRYEAIPSVIYTNPEVGCVGETEESARNKGIEFVVSSVPMYYNGRYVAENEGGVGICKVIVDKKYHKIIGMHLIGSYVSEIIFGAALMIETEMRVEDIKELVFPHPTVGEIISEALSQLKI